MNSLAGYIAIRIYKSFRQIITNNMFVEAPYKYWFLCHKTLFDLYTWNVKATKCKAMSTKSMISCRLQS